MISILEPFSNNSQLTNYRTQLGIDKDVCNSNGKIWLFWSLEVDSTIIVSDEQQMTCKIQHTQYPHKFIIIFVYAKCRDYLRHPL